MNFVGQTGRITKELQLKHTTQKKPYVAFQIAVRRKYKNADGDYDSDFFRVKAWGKTAENLVNTQKKGSLIGVLGRLESSSYTDPQSGKTVYTTEIIAEEIDYLEPKSARDNSNQPPQGQYGNQGNYQGQGGGQQQPQYQQNGYGYNAPPQQSNFNGGGFPPYQGNGQENPFGRY